MKSIPQSAGAWTSILCVALSLVNPAQPPAHGATGSPCTWREVRGERALDWRIGPVSCIRKTAEDVWAVLALDHDVPLSFVQADPEEMVSFELRDATVRQVLDAVVTRARSYRYLVIGERLVLFPRDAKWMRHIEGITLGPAPRLKVTSELAHELGHRVPGFAELHGTAVVGDPSSFIYRDPVTIAAPGTALDLLVQLLGERRSAVFSLSRTPWGALELGLSGVDLLQSFRLTAPTTTLKDRGETVQLRVVARLKGGGEVLDLTAASCGTTYSSENEGVVAVSPDGLVSVRGSGTAIVSARNEGGLSALRFSVVLPETETGPPPPAPLRGSSESYLFRPRHGEKMTVDHSPKKPPRS
jgi:hypothetical protein